MYLRLNRTLNRAYCFVAQPQLVGGVKLDIPRNAIWDRTCTDLSRLLQKLKENYSRVDTEFKRLYGSRQGQYPPPDVLVEDIVIKLEMVVASADPRLVLQAVHALQEVCHMGHQRLIAQTCVRAVVGVLTFHARDELVVAACIKLLNRIVCYHNYNWGVWTDKQINDTTRVLLEAAVRFPNNWRLQKLILDYARKAILDEAEDYLNPAPGTVINGIIRNFTTADRKKGQASQSEWDRQKHTHGSAMRLPPSDNLDGPCLFVIAMSTALTLEDRPSWVGFSGDEHVAWQALQLLNWASFGFTPDDEDEPYGRTPDDRADHAFPIPKDRPSSSSGGEDIIGAPAWMKQPEWWRSAT